MHINRFHPSPALAPYIREYLIIESSLESDSNIMPDTAMVMAFRYKGTVSAIGQEGKAVIPASIISGLRKSARQLQYEKDTANLLVVFKEAGISAFTRMPAHELFNQSVGSDHLFPAAQIRDITERLAEAGSHLQRIADIEAFFTARLIRRPFQPLINNAILLIRQQNGVIRIKDLVLSLHISQDAFEKRFRALVGATPKQYASIVRLRRLIDKYPSYASLTEASYDAGYFDQAHFIKDFRLFTGQAPAAFFASTRFW
jgi:AraC-like DNA-binding protein